MEQRASVTIDHSIENEKSERPPNHPSRHLTTLMRNPPSTPRCTIPLTEVAPQDNQSEISHHCNSTNRFIEREMIATVNHIGHVREAISASLASPLAHSRSYAEFFINDPDFGARKPTIAAELASKSAPDKTHRYDEEGFCEAFEEIKILQPLGTCIDAPQRPPYNPPHNPALGVTPMHRKQRFTDWCLKKQRSKRCVSSDQQIKAIGCLESDVPVISWPSVRDVVLFMDTIYNLVSLQFVFLNASYQPALRENERVSVVKIKGHDFSPSTPPDAVFGRRKTLYGSVQSPKAVDHLRAGTEAQQCQFFVSTLHEENSTPSVCRVDNVVTIVALDVNHRSASLNAAWYSLDYKTTDDGNGDISSSLSIQAKKHPDISRDLTRPGFTNTVICCAGFEDYDKMCIPASTTPRGTCSEGERWDDVVRCKHATAASKLGCFTDNTRLEISSTANQSCPI
jgi:hypothetical protein